jgi:hypothetical protein
MCSPSFTAITSGRDSVQQARQLQCRLVAHTDRCCDASEYRLSGALRKWRERVQSDVDDPHETSATRFYCDAQRIRRCGKL